jgi:putative FmdB family regulatory protein
MPVYEYVCTACKNKFEKMRPFSKSNEDADCPRCHKIGKRIISACYAKTTDSAGLTQQLGSSHSCSSCGGGSCASCGG